MSEVQWELENRDGEVKLDDRYGQVENDLTSFWELRFIPAEKLHRF